MPGMLVIVVGEGNVVVVSQRWRVVLGVLLAGLLLLISAPGRSLGGG